LIVFCHLYNDNSGSPKVLFDVINAAQNYTKNSILYIGSQGNGVLSQSSIPIKKFWYKRWHNRYITLITYFLSQACLFVSLLKDKQIKKDAVIYVNTLLPFAAALYGKITGRKVIYHLHEVSITPPLFKWFLIKVVNFSASEVVYVSKFLAEDLPVKASKRRIIYNSINEILFDWGLKNKYHFKTNGKFVVLMLASLRDYKGVPEFIEIASRFTGRNDIHFELVLNDTQQYIDIYFKQITIPHNVTVFPRTDNPEQFYIYASLVLNLSRVDKWIETFGLTLLEAMVFGVPVIAPPLGGPVELLGSDLEEFLIDSRKKLAVETKILELKNDEEFSKEMSVIFRKRAMQFSPSVFKKQIRDLVLEEKQNSINL
jgi:L-malate glycosyltransferase